MELLMSDEKDPLVREEQGFGASSLSVVRQGRLSSHAPADKS
jgi:hypothetical protein